MAGFDGKVALLAGAAAGIGRAAAKLLAERGAQVVIGDVDEARGEAAVSEIAEAGGQARFVRLDVTSEASVEAGVAETVAVFGPPTVHVNFAGGSMTEDDVVTDVDLDRVWTQTIDLNLRGTVLTCRHVIPHMVAAGGGSIVTMSSGAALRGASPSHIYTAAKGGVIALTRALAGRYARDNIRANTVCSGRVFTERILGAYGRPGEPGPVFDAQDAAGRVVEYPFWTGEPHDMAAIVAFVASDEARMMTGAVLQADGGRSSY